MPPSNPFNPNHVRKSMPLSGILPTADDVEDRQAIKLPAHIPRAAVFEIRSEADVDALPRGAIAHLVAWDDDLAFDLVVAGAGVTLLSRADQAQLSEHEDFDPDGFGVLDADGIWLPGLDEPYAPTADGWQRPEGALDDSEE